MKPRQSIRPRRGTLSPAIFLGLAWVALRSPSSATEDKPLIDFGAAGVESWIKINDGQSGVTYKVVDSAKGKALEVTCAPGESAYPGIVLLPEGTVWDLSAFGHVDAQVANTGEGKSGLSLRVDNDGDWQANPWNGETTWLNPGQTASARVYFGYSWGKPGYALDPAKVTRVLLFVAKSDKVQTYRIESVVAGGPPGDKPPVDPNQVRAKPPAGVLLGKGVPVDAAKHLVLRKAQAELVGGAEGQSLRVTLPAGTGDASALLKPEVGCWDLRDHLQVLVHARNAGQAPVTLKARLENPGRPSEWVVAAAPLAPGAEEELTLPFAGDMATWDEAGKRKPGGTRFESDRASGVAIAATGEGERVLVVDSIRAVLPPPLVLPDWLGKRPPVPGEWKQTLAEGFDGTTIDGARWSVYGPNYWDKRCHFGRNAGQREVVEVGNSHRPREGVHPDCDPRSRRGHCHGKRILMPRAVGLLHRAHRVASAGLELRVAHSLPLSRVEEQVDPAGRRLSPSPEPKRKLLPRRHRKPNARHRRPRRVVPLPPHPQPQGPGVGSLGHDLRDVLGDDPLLLAALEASVG